MKHFHSAEATSRWADQDTVVFQQEEHFQYSIWVSFFEIYNELAYDLLDTAPTANRKRQTLKLCEDKNGNTYVKGTCPHVRTACLCIFIRMCSFFVFFFQHL